MYKIYLDTSERNINKVTLYKDGSVIESVENSEDICDTIKNLLSKHHTPVEKVEFDYFEGPANSFTGLKVSAAIVNTLNMLKSSGRGGLKLPNYGREPNISQPKL